VTKKDVLGRLTAEIRRIEEQRDAVAERIEQANQRLLGKLSKQRLASTSEANASDETAIMEPARVEEGFPQESQVTEPIQTVASEPSRMVEETEPYRDEEKRHAHREHYEELAEERYEAEVEIEEALGKLVEGLKRLKAIDADQRREAEAVGIPTDYNLSRLVEGRLSRRLKGWMLVRVVGPTEAFAKPLYEIDDQAKRPGE
jgi:hypothetical protein